MDRIKIESRARLHALVAAAATALVAGLACVPSSALAQHARRPPPHWHGDIARFHEHDWAVWRGGHWTHARHDGRLAWWWVVGGTWYVYPWPVYPYPNPWDPPPAVLQAPATASLPPPTPYWYFCEASNTYYPYVATCPGGWKQVPAVPAEAASEPR